MDQFPEERVKSQKHTRPVYATSKSGNLSVCEITCDEENGWLKRHRSTDRDKGTMKLGPKKMPTAPQKPQVTYMH